MDFGHREDNPLEPAVDGRPLEHFGQVLLEEAGDFFLSLRFHSPKVHTNGLFS